MTKHCRNHRIRWQKKIDFSYLGPGGALENKWNLLKPLFCCKKSFAFQKKRANLADQNKQQQQRACHVPDMTSQYETNLWSTHVNIVRLAEPIRRCVRWRTQVFKIEEFVCKRFLPSPPPPPSFIFWLSFHFSRGQNRPFFAPKPGQMETLATQAKGDMVRSSHSGVFLLPFLTLK